MALARSSGERDAVATYPVWSASCSSVTSASAGAWDRSAKAATENDADRQLIEPVQQVEQEFQRRVVAPVQVIDRDQRRGGLGSGSEHAEDRVRDRVAIGRLGRGMP
jgi:hypothetical protein